MCDRWMGPGHAAAITRTSASGLARTVTHPGGAAPGGARPGRRDVARAIAPGTRLGRYEIVAPLGAGSMGIVLEAIDTELQRGVALKLVRPGIEDPGAARAMLRREAQVMARLAHANVAAIFDLGTSGDDVFLAMELVRGGTLRDLAGHRRTWRRQLRALIDAGRGLAAAHERGVLHRDIKPDNVLVHGDGTVRLADFGVACELGAPPGDAPCVAGTPAYMAPEGFEGAAAPATDQFAFGVMAFEVLEDRLPFDVTATVEDHLQTLRQGHRPSWRRDAVPPRVRRAIDRAMAADPSARWPSIRTLCAALEAGL